MGREFTIKDIRQLLDEAGQKMGLACDQVPVEISRRMVRTYGLFIFRRGRQALEPVAFRFAARLLDGDFAEDIFRQVVLHEYAHFYANTKDNKNHGHDRVFKETCRRLGIPEDTKLITPSHDQRPGYAIYCKACGKLVAQRRRRDTAQRLVNGYRSACCQARLVGRQENF